MLCGYCDRDLTALPSGVLRCESCQPKLAAIKTADEYAQFVKEEAWAIERRRKAAKKASQR